MDKSEKAKKNNEYIKKNYKTLPILFPFETIERIQAAYPGKPIATYVKELIKQDLDKKTE